MDISAEKLCGDKYPKHIAELFVENFKHTLFLHDENHAINYVQSDNVVDFYNYYKDFPDFFVPTLIYYAYSTFWGGFGKPKVEITYQMLECFKTETAKKFFKLLLKDNEKNQGAAIYFFENTLSVSHSYYSKCDITANDFSELKKILKFGSEFPIIRFIDVKRFEGESEPNKNLLNVILCIENKEVQNVLDFLNSSPKLKKILLDRSDSLEVLYSRLLDILLRSDGKQINTVKLFKVIEHYGKRFDLIAEIFKVFLFASNYGQSTEQVYNNFLDYITKKRVSNSLKKIRTDADFCTKLVCLSYIQNSEESANLFLNLLKSNLQVAGELAKYLSSLENQELKKEETEWLRDLKLKAPDMKVYRNLINSSKLPKLFEVIVQSSDELLQENLRNLLKIDPELVPKAVNFVLEHEGELKKRAKICSVLLPFSDYFEKYIESGSLDFVKKTVKDYAGGIFPGRFEDIEDLVEWVQLIAYIQKNKKVASGMDYLGPKITKYRSFYTWFKKEKSKELKKLSDMGIDPEKYVDSGLIVGKTNVGSKSTEWVPEFEETYKFHSKLGIKKSFRKKLDFSFEEAKTGNISAALEVLGLLEEWVTKNIGEQKQEIYINRISMARGAIKNIDGIPPGTLICTIVKRELPKHILYDNELGCCTFLPRGTRGGCITHLADPKTNYLEFELNNEVVGRIFLLASETIVKDSRKTTLYVDTVEGSFNFKKLILEDGLYKFIMKCLKKSAKICGFKRFVITKKVTNKTPDAFVQCVDSKYGRNSVDSISVIPLFDNENVSEIKDCEHYLDSLPKSLEGTIAGFVFDL